jgi:hypothetical protein
LGEQKKSDTYIEFEARFNSTVIKKQTRHLTITGSK